MAAPPPHARRGRPRIVLFTAGHTEPNGGLAQHSRLLAEGFAAEGWDVRVVSRAGSLRRPRRVSAPGLRVLELPGFGRPRLGAALYLLVAAPLGTWWARTAVGCLSVHLGATTVAAGISAGLWRKPFIALSTSSGPDGEVAEAVACRPGSLRRRILRRATALVAQSTATAPELAPLTEPDRIAVVPNPVVRPVPPPLDGRPHVLFLGRLSKEKEPGLLLDAWRTVAEAVPDARLDFVGAGGDWRSVEGELRGEVAATPALTSSVTFTGWSSDVPGVLAAHDVFVQSSSSFEGMSNSLLEACAHGRVIVASDIAPNVAVLGSDYPLLFPSGDASALAAQLLVALRDDDTRATASAMARGTTSANEIASVVAAHASLLRPQPSSSP